MVSYSTIFSCTVCVRSDAAWRSYEKAAVSLGWTIAVSKHNTSSKVFTQAVRSTLLAESLDVREALLCCKSLEIATLRCELDSAQLIKDINDKEPMLRYMGLFQILLRFLPLLILSPLPGSC
ncbi:hypothetical protein F2Q69_00021163 [Brassica cretica]|uniref:RNase H type-1 domain-containing protein n=1 Tax=Brassica cretica TaxID=69181 RepID=A0A8S9QH41_BRACR|nr:hypothetical protein F2Q69_00021163 [Brassica cretica]